MRRFLSASAFIVATVLAAPAIAQPAQQAPPGAAQTDNEALNLALAAIQRDDHETALELLRPLARKGNRVAQHDMGVMFATGKGVRQDYTAAQSFFRMAAAQRYVPSLWSLGLVFAQGEGVRPDLLEAYKWFELARQQLEAEGEANIDRDLRPKIETALMNLEMRLGAQGVHAAKARAANWDPESGRHEANKQAINSVRTGQDYNRLCQKYAGFRKGIRAYDDMVRREGSEGNFDLTACLSMIEYAWMTKDCDGREPVVSRGAILHEGAGQLPRAHSQF
jgi:TPR repeat protein